MRRGCLAPNTSDRSRITDERGNALLIAFGLTLLLAAAVTVDAAVVTRATNQSVLYGNTSQASLAALGGLNTTIAQMRNSTSLNGLPCALTGSETSTGATGSYTVAVTYSSAGTNLTCNGAGSRLGGSTQPSAAKLVSTGTAPGAPAATMQEDVAIAAGTTTDALGYAIFTENALTLYNGDSVNKVSGGNSPDEYAGTTLTCGNGAVSQGNVITYVPAGATLAGNCSYTGNLTSANQVTLQNSVNIGGSVTSYGGGILLSGNALIKGNATETNGNINVTNGTIDGNAYATGSISISGGGSIKGSQSPGDVSLSGQSIPTALPFPVFQTGSTTYYGSGTQTITTITVATWQSEGWSVIQVPSPAYPTCSSFFANNSSGAADAFMVDLESTIPTVIWAPTCTVTYNRAHVFELGANMILQAAQVNFQGSNTFCALKTNACEPASQTSTTYSLSILVDVGTPCSTDAGNPVAMFSNQSSFYPNVDSFIYTPGEASYANNPTMTGQIWACGGFIGSNAFALSFVPVATTGLPFITSGLNPAVAPLDKFLLSL